MVRTREIGMTEDKVREIYSVTDFNDYTREELREADQWVKDYALKQLGQSLMDSSASLSLQEYVLLMTRVHYGSVETDNFLRAHQCYPEWLKGVQL
jgi:hypothetical protein